MVLKRRKDCKYCLQQKKERRLLRVIQIRLRREYPYRDKRITLLKSKIYTSYYAYISLKEGIQNAHRNKLLNEEIRIGRSFSNKIGVGKRFYKK